MHAPDLGGQAQQASSSGTVSLVVPKALGHAGRHGCAKLAEILARRGYDIEEIDDDAKATGHILFYLSQVSGTADTAGVPLLPAEVAIPTAPEGLAIAKAGSNGRPAIYVCGYDDRGLMYGALDVADRLAWPSTTDDPLSRVRDVNESPFVPERAVSKLVLNQSEFESYFFDEAYWARYFDALAESRFNTFVMLFGYDGPGYFEPPYPFLFDVDGFPDIRVIGLSSEAQRRNLDMMNRVIAMAHERGLLFTFAIWTHICRGGHGIERPLKPIPGVVWGLTDGNLIDYSEAALAQFIKLLPEFDNIQFRVHIESALSLPQQRAFWDRIYEAIRNSGKEMRVDMRVKGFTDDLIDASLSSGLNIRLATKYWGEHLGLPYHPTHTVGKDQFKRRHSYADLLTYPRRYKMHYRVWNEGTTRVLLWGDPEYVRRFAPTTHLWDGEGFEVHEPLAKKMQGWLGRERYELLQPEYRWYTWEFERYWHFFQSFGRATYNPDTPAEVWRESFNQHFGQELGCIIEEALHRASQVLPMIIAYNLFDLTAGGYWPEKQRWLDLPKYASAEPSDTAQFVGIEEAAVYMIKGDNSPKIWPQKTSQWFAQASDGISSLVTKAEASADSDGNRELASTLVDLKILAGLARYHSVRIHAGLNWALFQHSGDLHALDSAIAHEEQAVNVWEEIVSVTEGVYHDNLIMGPGIRPQLTGSWRDELIALEEGLAELRQCRSEHRPLDERIVARFDFTPGNAADGFLAVGPDTVYSSLAGGYGWHHAYLLPDRTSGTETGGRGCETSFLHGPPPMQYTYSAFGADLPSGHYQLDLVFRDSSDAPQDYGPMWVEANGMDSTERFVVPAGRTVEVSLETTVTDDRLNVVFNSQSDSRWLINGMIVKEIGPAVSHVPVRRAAPGSDLIIRATVTGRDPIERVCVGLISRGEGHSLVEMPATEPSMYQATIPGSLAGEDLEYYIEAVDSCGRRGTFPSAGSQHPIRITVSDDVEPPVITHTALEECQLGEPLTVQAHVADTAGISWVRLRYRGVSQHQDFRTLRMLPTSDPDTYRATIPAAHIRPEWDLMYYIEAMDVVGNGRIFPDLAKETPYHVVRVKR